MNDKWIKLPDEQWGIKFKCAICGCTYITEGVPPLYCHHCKEKEKSHG